MAPPLVEEPVSKPVFKSQVKRKDPNLQQALINLIPILAPDEVEKIRDNQRSEKAAEWRARNC